MSTEPRIVIVCHTCGATASWPDKGLGRASAASWETRHQEHDYTRSVR